MNTKPRKSRAPRETLEPASPATVEVAVVAAWRLSQGLAGTLEILVTRRPAGTHLAGRWELPGGKIKAGESVQEAARRELAEEAGLQLDDFEPLITVEYAYPDRRVRIHALLARLEGPEAPAHLAVADHRWVVPADLAMLDLPPANAPITAAIIERFQSEQIAGRSSSPPRAKP